MLTQTYVTPEGRAVVSGVFRCYETIGMPLDVLLTILWDKNAIPDWLSFFDEAVKAGMKRDRILAKVEEAAYDTYGAEFGEQVMLRLRRHR